MLTHLGGKPYHQAFIRCPDCKHVMVLKLSNDKQKVYYSCNPGCNFHPAYPDGRPQGEVAPRKLKEARKACWEQFDAVAGAGNRKAYEWLKRTWGSSKISTFNAQQCIELKYELFRIDRLKNDRRLTSR